MRGKYEREESPAPDCINTLVNRLNCARCRPGSQPPRGGFWALFCCRSEHSDTNYAALPRAQQPSSADDQYKKVPSGLPISVVPPNTGDKSSPDGLPVQVSGHRPEAQRPTSQDNTKPAFPQPQPTPIGQHPPRQPPQGVSDLRKRYEVNGATPSPYYHPPGSRQPSAPSPKFREFIGWALSSSDQKGVQTDGAKFFAGSINLDDDDEMLEIQRLKGKQLQDVVTQLQAESEYLELGLSTVADGAQQPICA